MNAIDSLREGVKCGDFSKYHELLIEEMIVGFKRYEKVRKLTPREFYNLYVLSLNKTTFDEQVDKL